ncbi:hypothetical protein C8R44DRAFT_887803 [Mycena epipterygia]|nr:hypothetical protein C8R44DRAFT_887803 [Mycena epipterygia]
MNILCSRSHKYASHPTRFSLIDFRYFARVVSYHPSPDMPCLRRIVVHFALSVFLCCTPAYPPPSSTFLCPHSHPLPLPAAPFSPLFSLAFVSLSTPKFRRMAIACPSLPAGPRVRRGGPSRERLSRAEGGGDFVRRVRYSRGADMF